MLWKLKDRFVGEVRNWYRHASMWIAGLAALILPALLSSPDLIMMILREMPADMRAWMPFWMPPVIFGALFVTRYWKQRPKGSDDAQKG